MKWPEKTIHRAMKLSVSYTYRSEVSRIYALQWLAIWSPNKPLLSRREENADSKTDSKTGGKTRIMGDTSEQNGTKRKISSRLTSHSATTQ
ncbi:MAG TPA: hypothetical protein VEP90_14630 [Methylomirabilota bacterium]|nr:hypothetical protein [Methylomirabilota bacterium]